MKNWPAKEQIAKAMQACNEWAEQNPWSSAMTAGQSKAWDEKREAIWHQALRETTND